VVGAAAVALAACGLDPDPGRDGGDPVGGQTGQGLITPTGGPCPQFACGANSPTIDTLGFHELNLFDEKAALQATLPNDAGLSIRAVNRRAQIFDRTGVPYDLRVVDGRFIGSNCHFAPCVTLQGPALVGATIQIVGGKFPAQIAITSVREIGYFLDPGVRSTAIETYTLMWNTPGGPATNLCNNIKLLEQQIAAQPGGSDGEYGRQELMGMRTFESVVFEGDRIDAVHRTTAMTANDNWFNIGCAGATLSKLRLTHNTIHTGPTGATPVPWQHQQATLKMLSADYCGTGTAFTVPGQRMVWKGDAMTNFYTPAQELEARWNETGASCLGVPRMEHPTFPTVPPKFPDVMAMILQECPTIKPCTNINFADFDGQPRVSANPILPVP
jgi:hypothetical protein